MANPGKRKEALPVFHFEVTIKKSTYPFRSCSGLKADTKVVDVEEGGNNYYVEKLPGPTSFPPLVLRQGFCDPASPLYQLYREFISEGKPKDRITGIIKQLGPNGTSAKYEFRGGWISKWEVSELDASKNEIAIESIEIVHRGIVLLGSGGPGAGSSENSGGFGVSVKSIFGGGGGAEGAQASSGSGGGISGALTSATSSVRNFFSGGSTGGSSGGGGGGGGPTDPTGSAGGP